MELQEMQDRLALKDSVTVDVAPVIIAGGNPAGVIKVPDMKL